MTVYIVPNEPPPPVICGKCGRSMADHGAWIVDMGPIEYVCPNTEDKKYHIPWGHVLVLHADGSYHTEPRQ